MLKFGREKKNAKIRSVINYFNKTLTTFSKNIICNSIDTIEDVYTTIFNNNVVNQRLKHYNLIKSNENISISVCLTCKNRTKHLEQTLEHNIEILDKIKTINNNFNYEICLINYNSIDYLHSFMREIFYKYKYIKYFVTKIPDKFNISVAKNICAYNSKYDNLLFLDADNFLSLTYMNYIIENSKYYKIMQCQDTPITRGYNGRIYCKKECFLDNEYPEYYQYYGEEDNTFISKYKSDIHIVPYIYYHDTLIQHDHAIRTENYDTHLTIHEMEKKNLESNISLSNIYILCDLYEHKFIYEINKYNLDWYYINLEHRSDRKMNCLNLLGKNAKRINAIIGKNIWNSDIHTNLKFWNAGAYGCYLSHVKAIETFYFKSSKNECIICEDDISISTQFWEHFKIIRHSLPKEWDVIYLSVNMFIGKNAEIYSDHFLTSHGSTGAMCYMINKKSAKFILDYILRSKSIECIDILLSTIPNIKQYVYIKKIVKQMKSYSDIVEDIIDYSDMESYNCNNIDKLHDLKHLYYTKNQKMILSKHNYKSKLFDYKLYWINLDRAVFRNKQFTCSVAPLFKECHRIQAVDGNNLGDELKEYKASKYEKACFLSHINAIKTAFNNGDEYALIGEDDLLIDIQQVETYFDYFIEQDDEWDILKLCEVNENHEAKQEIKTFIKHTFLSWGTQLYLIKRSGMKKILNIEKWPDDNYENTLVADYGIYQACNTLCTIPSFVIQNYEDSEIQSQSILLDMKQKHCT